MQDFLRRLAHAFTALSTLALWVAGAALVLMTAIVSWQVFGRYVLGATPRWAEVSAILLMGWFIFLGAAVGVRDKFHLGFDILLYVVPTRVKIVMRYISDVAVGAFGFGMLWYGWQIAAVGWQRPMPVIGLPSGFNMVPVIIGGALIILFSIERVLRRAAGLDPDGDLVALGTTLGQE